MLLEEGYIICPLCGGDGNYEKPCEDCRSDGEVRYSRSLERWTVCEECDGNGFIDIECPKCNGRGKLDWIENVIGANSIYMTPGVYVQEVDLSWRIPRHPSEIEEIPRVEVILDD